MYPATFFGLFPPFPRDHRVFVAMSFDPRFEARWTSVLRPAISAVEMNGQQLQAHRADLALAGDSILTEILDHITRCRAFIADVTALGHVGETVVRNQNVFYEVGLAHAARLSEEVLLFRSDDLALAFDISNVRVHRYDPDGHPERARAVVTETLAGALRELDLRKQLAVRRAADSLDYESIFVLAQAQQASGMNPPVRQTMRQALSAGARLDAISRLLEMGAIQATFLRVSPQMMQAGMEGPAEQLVQYKATPFGSALFDHVVQQMGLTSPELRDQLERNAGDDRSKGEA